MRFIAAVLVVAVGCRPPGYGQDDQPEADAAAPSDASPGSDATTAADAPGPAPDAAACTVGFFLANHGGATTVWLSGDFVAWGATPAAGAIELVREPDLVWRVQVGFAPGSYQYKFIVDGSQWIADPANANTVPDGVGGVNSVFTCP